MELRTHDWDKSCQRIGYSTDICVIPDSPAIELCVFKIVIPLIIVDGFADVTKEAVWAILSE